MTRLFRFCWSLLPGTLNTLRPRQSGRYFADDIFKCIFLNENARISLKISLKFVPEVRIDNIPALVQIMAWRRPGDKPLSEPMMVKLPTHICITRPQWVKPLNVSYSHKNNNKNDMQYGCVFLSEIWCFIQLPWDLLPNIYTKGETTNISCKGKVLVSYWYISSITIAWCIAKSFFLFPQ